MSPELPEPGVTVEAMDEDQSISPDDAETYLRITKLREAAEAKFGRHDVERATEEYRQIREELQTHPYPPYERRDELQRRAARLCATYGYEVLAGVPNVLRGDHPRHDWTV